MRSEGNFRPIANLQSAIFILQSTRGPSMRSLVRATLVAWTAVTAASTVHAQGQPVPARVEVEPASLALEVGDEVRLEGTVFDSAGNVIAGATVFYFVRSRDLAVTREGVVEALKGGEYQILVFVPTPGQPLRAQVPVTVAFPPVTRVDITPGGERFYVGAAVRHRAIVTDASGATRDDVNVEWSSSDRATASVSPTGLVTAAKPGRVTIRAVAEGVRAERAYQVMASPVRRVEVTADPASGRTGDVIHVAARAFDERGRAVADAPVTFIVLSQPVDSVVAQFSAAEIDDRGRFVAYKAGLHTVMAVSAGQTGQLELSIAERHRGQRVDMVGQGAVRDVRTSDLWVWEGPDGRDYAVTGTWGAQGAAYFWDVTDPAVPVLTDSIVVDARTVNEVKVSEDGSICVITREGASNRRNGIYILDCTNPRDIKVHSTLDDGLTGGVHNVFVYDNHVYAVNNGQKYDIISIEDPKNPRRVAVFQLDVPGGSSIHDVWVVDGIAYSSHWGNGVALVDVGNGIAGGTPSNPVLIAHFADVGGATHAAFPYRSPTGKFYVFMGDEIGRDNGGAADQDNLPPAMAGYIHVVDFSDPLNPEEVARYEVPEAGSHNLWIQGDTLYAAFYNGGLRVVDISGELKGNLTYQGREMARFMAYDPEGFVANAPFTWGPQPYKGHIFIAEHHSGLWAVKLRTPEALTP